MTILAVYAIIVVYVANSKVQACTDGQQLKERDICSPILTCTDGKWPTPENLFDKKCKRCYIHNDPHFINFLEMVFDWHGTSTYSIAQEFFSTTPSYYIYGKFDSCYDKSAVSCIGEITYQVSTALKIQFSPTSYFEVITIKNGESAIKQIPAGPPTEISNTPQVVLAWILDNCLMIMANKGYTIKFCGSYMYIWVPESIERQTQGLCGTTDDHDKGLLLKRDSPHQLTNTVANVTTFAESWQTHTRRNHYVDTKISQGSACTANETELTKFTIVCTENIQADLTSELMKVAIDNCVFDRCVIMQAINGDGNVSYSVAAEWLNQAVNAAEDQAKIIKNTINFADACEGSQGYRGKCFGTQEDLFNYSRCDSLLRDATGCKDGESCCVDCSLQTDLCNSAWENSVARNVYSTINQCCRNERVIGQVRPGSECFCCIRCKPVLACKEKRGRCITDKDPVLNKEWCSVEKNGTIHEDWCVGDGCSCCIWDRK